MNDAPPPYHKMSYTNVGNDNDADFIRRNNSSKYPLHRRTHNDNDVSLKPPLTTTSSSSSPLRKYSLSSHASDIGKKLAMERSKNAQLLSRIRELEEMGEFRSSTPPASHYYHDTTNDDYDDDEGDGGGTRLFTSSPVSTPPRPGRMMATPTKSPACGDTNYKDNYDGYYYQRGSAHHTHSGYEREQLEEALRIETQRREAAEQEVANLTLLLKSNKNVAVDRNKTPSTQISNDDLEFIEELVHRASNLLARTSSNGVGPSDENDELLDNQMKEYHELATAFYTEQQAHSELDGEEFVPREDIVWLLHELKWRYEDILTNYERRKVQRNNSDIDEWKDCVNDMVTIMKKVAIASDYHDDGGINVKLREQSSYISHQHTETNHSNSQGMEKMKREYHDQIANMSQLISELESKLLVQGNEQRTLQEAIEEERQKMALSNEGTFARIRYLEGMVRSLEMELRNTRAKANQDNNIPTDDAPMPIPPPSRPVFMRDLTSDVMQDMEIPMQDASDSNEITTLRDQITCLGNSLAESENERAALLEEFQEERQNYMMQFKQMSELLKQFTEGTECNQPT